jgi:sulfate adenylyltransferase large subunit
VTGASTANVAIILIDARLGVLQQSRRHATIASLLGIPHLAVCVNKMDLVAFDPGVFDHIRTELSLFTKNLAFTDVTFFPISALRGDNCVRRSAHTAWYIGPTVLEFLETVPVHQEGDLAQFRFPVQYVLRPNLDYRGFAGRVASGVVKRGDTVVVLPSGRTSRVKAIDTGDGEVDEAFAAQSVTIRIEDEIDVSRGDMLAHPRDLPRIARTFDAHLVWMHDAALDPGKTYLLKHTTQTVRATVDRVQSRKDMDTLADVPAMALGLNDIGRVTITAHRPLLLDAYEAHRETGSFILIDALSNATVGAGMVIALSGPPMGEAAVRPPSAVGAVIALLVEDSESARAELDVFARELSLREAEVIVLHAHRPAAALAGARAVADAGHIALVGLATGAASAPAIRRSLDGCGAIVLGLRAGDAPAAAAAAAQALRERGALR